MTILDEELRYLLEIWPEHGIDHDPQALTFTASHLVDRLLPEFPPLQAARIVRDAVNEGWLYADRVAVTPTRPPGRVYHLWLGLSTPAVNYWRSTVHGPVCCRAARKP